MRSPQILLLIPILLFVVYFLYDTKANEPPTEGAAKFLQTLQQNNLEGALREFGDNTCHCAPEGGYIAYLQYESGHDPNLAFLMGHNFTVGKTRVEKLPYNGEKYFFPWDKPEDTIVYAPILFNQEERPYFLPLDMAYGYEMTEEQLKEFTQNPAKDWAPGFTLRLRWSLDKGVIPPRDPKAKKTEMERAAADGLLPKELLKYLHPKDAGPVKAGSETKPASAFAAELPKLHSVVLGMKVVRRGLLNRWSVKKVGMERPVLAQDGKAIPLGEELKPTAQVN
jgi:hypothetical protein